MSNGQSLDWSDWPDLKIAAFFGLGAVVCAIIEKGSVDINATGGKFGTALYTASMQGFEDVVNILLDHEADVNMRWDGQSPIYIAISGVHCAVVQLLFDRSTNEIEITMADFIEAAYCFERKEAEVLLEGLVNKLVFTPESLADACSSYRAHLALVLLIKYRGKEINITPEILLAAARNSSGGRVMSVLLRELERRQIQIEVNEETLIAAATNDRGSLILAQLFERTRIEDNCTPRVVAAAAGNKSRGVRLMGLLFEKRGFQIEITPEVISSAERNETQGRWVLELINIFRQNDKDPELILHEIAKRHAQLIEEGHCGPRRGLFRSAVPTYQPRIKKNG